MFLQRIRITRASDPPGTLGVLSFCADYGFRHESQKKWYATLRQTVPLTRFCCRRDTESPVRVAHTRYCKRRCPPEVRLACAVLDIASFLPACSIRFIAAWLNHLSLSYRLCHLSMRQRQGHFLWLSSMLTGGMSVSREGHTHRTRWFYWLTSNIIKIHGHTTFRKLFERCMFVSWFATTAFVSLRGIFTDTLVVVAYQVVHEPGIVRFRAFESTRVHIRTNSWGLCLVHKLTCVQNARRA